MLNPMTDETMRVCLDAYAMAEDQASRTLSILRNAQGAVWIEDALAEPDNRVLWESDAAGAQAHAVEALAQLRRRRIVLAIFAALVVQGAVTP